VKRGVYEMENGIEILLSGLSYSLACVGSLLLFIGGLIAYIFNRHTKDNDSLFKKNDHDHESFKRIEGK